MAETVSTSRIARMPVKVPTGVEVKFENDMIHFKGPKGEQKVKVHDFVKIEYKDDEIRVDLRPKTEVRVSSKQRKTYNSIAGTTQSNVSNAIEGVNAQFERKLKLVGVGYRAQAKGNVLALNLGFSHETNFDVPEGITIQTPSPTEIVVQGVNKKLVGDVAANIRKIRSPEPYKGKGVRYADERIVMKETKKK